MGGADIGFPLPLISGPRKGLGGLKWPEMVWEPNGQARRGSASSPSSKLQTRPPSTAQAQGSGCSGSWFRVQLGDFHDGLITVGF